MSRIAKRGVKIEDKVEIKQENNQVIVSGPKGTHSFDLKDNYCVEIIDGQAFIKTHSKDKEQQKKAFCGLYTRLLRNAVIGVHSGFVKKLGLIGVGYKAQMKGNSITLLLGYSHPIEYAIPEGVSVTLPDQTNILISGVDKQLVGQVAAEIRSYRKPEPYKGKGVLYYIDPDAGILEKIRMKEGKRGK